MVDDVDCRHVNFIVTKFKGEANFVLKRIVGGLGKKEGPLKIATTEAIAKG
jgi:hypothetical protein